MTALRRVLVVATVVAAAAVTSIVVAGLSAPPPSPGVKPSPTPAASGSAPVESPPAPTIGVWETPPPDATAPEGALAIPGIGISDLAAELGAARYSCESFKASTDILADAYVLSCTSAIGGATARVDAIYWTMDHVMTIHAAVLPVNPGGEIRDATAAAGLLRPLLQLPYTGSNPAATEAWFANQSGNAACEGNYCRESFGEVRYELELGAGGAMQLHIEGLAGQP